MKQLNINITTESMFIFVIRFIMVLADVVGEFVGWYFDFALPLQYRKMRQNLCTKLQSISPSRHHREMLIEGEVCCN